MSHPCTDGCCLDDRHVQPCIGDAVIFMIVLLLSCDDDYCLMSITYISYSKTKVKENFQSVLNSK